ncbi:hypothetical protein [Burkholderia gladioli]|uniref:hypothetical protein n=1 Tax=Burkholderia gladioli TaxID=28095 RepID=UPI003FA52773
MGKPRVDRIFLDESSSAGIASPRHAADEVVLRDVPTGAGVLDLVEWTDAVKATGYRGWLSCELFCRRRQQQNGFRVPVELKALMTRLIESPRAAQAGTEARPR